LHGQLALRSPKENVEKVWGDQKFYKENPVELDVVRVRLDKKEQGVE